MKYPLKWQYLYNNKWDKYSKARRNRYPLCVMCMAIDHISPAEVTDHVVPHKGDIKLFWDKSNHQSLCKQCHDSAKAIQESKGYLPGCNADGMPIDPKHPWNEE